MLPVDRAVAARAARLRARNPTLRLPDALIVATADVGDGVGVVLGADRAWTKLKGVRSRVELLVP